MPLDQVHDRDNMTFLEHLEALRWHIMRSIAAVFLFAVILFAFGDFLFDKVIFGPRSADFWTYQQMCKLSQYLYGDNRICIEGFNFDIQNLKVTGQFVKHITISAIGGVILGFPYIIWEIWRFVKPALGKGEIQNSKGFMFYCSLLFGLGLLFGYFIISPISLNFLGNYSVSDKISNQISLDSYISFISSLSFATGLMFELPLVIYFLAKMGLLTVAFLKKYRKHALIVILILSSIITPPDLASQIILTIPIYFLYEIGIIVAERLEKKNKLAK